MDLLFNIKNRLTLCTNVLFNIKQQTGMDVLFNIKNRPSLYTNVLFNVKKQTGISVLFNMFEIIGSGVVAKSSGWFESNWMLHANHGINPTHRKRVQDPWCTLMEVNVRQGTNRLAIDWEGQSDRQAVEKWCFLQRNNNWLNFPVASDVALLQKYSKIVVM